MFNVMNDDVVVKIYRYATEGRAKLDSCTSRAEIKQRSNAQWIIYEILNLLMDSPNALPAIVIEEFLTKLWYGREGSTNPEDYDVLIETVEDIYNSIL